VDAETLRRAYDRSAEDYDARFAELQRVKYEAMLAGAPVRGRVLDAGAGTGLLARWLAERASADARPGLQIVALDVSAAMLRKTRGDRVQADLARPPFKPARFDWVCAFTSIIGADNVAPALAALARLVAPGGTLVASILPADLENGPEPQAPGLAPVRARVPCGQDLGFLWRRPR
jgi:SAM-dependent methyltransferase